MCQKLPKAYQVPDKASVPAAVPRKATADEEPYAAWEAMCDAERAPSAAAGGEEPYASWVALGDDYGEPDASYVAMWDDYEPAVEQDPDVLRYEDVFDEASSDEAAPVEPVPDEDMLDAEAETSPAPRT